MRKRSNFECRAADLCATTNSIGSQVSVCPCCGGAGTIELAPPVQLTPMQFRVWDAVRKSRHGLTASTIAESVYADRYDGGPLHARTCIYLVIRSANRRLKPAGVEIACPPHTRGGVYRVQRISVAAPASPSHRKPD